MGGPGGGPWRHQRWSGPETWSMDHQARFRRLRRMMAAGFTLTLVLPVVLAAAITAAFAGWTGAAAAAAISLAVVATGLLVGRFVFRGFRSVNDMMQATGRLADGDYSARISADVPPALGPVVGSFNTMAQRLEQSDELRRRLLADVGHELRTPLTIIRGELEAMADGVHELGETELRRLLVDVAGMERLLDDLRTLSTTEAGVLELHPEPVDLHWLVAEAVERFRTESRSRSINLGVRSGAGEGAEPVMAEVDAMRMSEVVSNLVANALRAVEPGGRVDVTVGRSDGWLTVEVGDDGRGIGPEQLANVFDRFAKGRESDGSGLGLTISRSLVEAHGGTIEASSVVGQGTTMTVRLPGDHRAEELQ